MKFSKAIQWLKIFWSEFIDEFGESIAYFITILAVFIMASIVIYMTEEVVNFLVALFLFGTIGITWIFTAIKTIAIVILTNQKWKNHKEQ